MRVLIVGASGFIGQYLRQRLLATEGYEVSGSFQSRKPPKPSAASISDEERLAWYHAEVTDPQRLAAVFQEVRPEVVVHLAAIADIGKCETDPERATAVNVTGTENLAVLCGQHGAKLVFLSTEYVFKGDRGSYTETDIPQPETHYGRTKWQAEQVVGGAAARNSILRTSLVYGWPPEGNRNLAALVIERLEAGVQFSGHTDMYRTPIYVEHLVEGIVKLMEGDHPGISHVAGADQVNMYQFAQAVADVFALDGALVIPVESSDASPSQTPGIDIPRPKMLGLDSTETAQRLGMHLPGIIQGLEQMRDKRRDSS